MAITIEIDDEPGTTLTTTHDEQRTIVAQSRPVVVTGNDVQSVAIEVLKGLPGDQRVFVGATPPSNPQEGQIWIDTSAG